VSLEPDLQLWAARPATGEIEEQYLLFVNIRVEVVAVQAEEHLHRRMRDSLVAVYEWVVRAREYAKAAALAVTVG
jgi:hypothetical protein